MNRWSEEPQQQQTPQRSLAIDMLSVGPASTPRRELLAAVIQLGAVALLLLVIFPDRVPDLWRWALLGASVMYFVFRAAVGLPKWRRG